MRVALAAMALAACSGTHTGVQHSDAPPPPPSDRPVEVVVTGGTPAVDVPDLVLHAARSAGVSGADCSLLWGDVAATPSGARRATIVVDAKPVVTGWIACGAGSADFATINPRTHQIALVSVRGGEVRAGHPSGPGTSPVDLAKPVDPAERRTFALFGVDGKDGATARDLVPVLEGLPRVFVFVLWSLGG